MNGSPAFPATTIDLAFGLIYRILEFLAWHIRACSWGTTHAMISRSATRMDAPARPDGRRRAALRRTRVRRNGGRPASSGGARATLGAREQFGWMVAFVLNAFRYALVPSKASGRLATLIEVSSQPAREMRYPARRCGVVLPSGCFPRTDKQFPRADKRTAKVQATAGEPVCDRARAAGTIRVCGETRLDMRGLRRR